MKIKAIVCIDKNGGMGKDNSMPWNMPSDLRHFKSLTEGHIVVYGRKTFESMGSQPLPNRTNVILSRNMSREDIDKIRETHQGVLVTDFWKDAQLLRMPNQDMYIIGGSLVFNDTLRYCDEVIVTQLSESFNCDTHFPTQYLGGLFKKEKVSPLKTTSKDSCTAVIKTYTKE